MIIGYDPSGPTFGTLHWLLIGSIGLLALSVIAAALAFVLLRGTSRGLKIFACVMVVVFAVTTTWSAWARHEAIEQVQDALGVYHARAVNPTDTPQTAGPYEGGFTVVHTNPTTGEETTLDCNVRLVNGHGDDAVRGLRTICSPGEAWDADSGSLISYDEEHSK